MPRALLSVSDKSGLVEFARSLVSLGYELVTTGGTARALVEAGLPVTGVSEVTGFPEMMDGRLKTLHPKIHGGILARRSRPDDIEAASRHGIGMIDIVVVNLYPFVRAAADVSTSFDGLVEQIDIGGPTMVRAAAKSFGDVLVVVDPADYPGVTAALRSSDGVSLELRLQLARKAFAHTGAYDTAIAAALSATAVSASGIERVRPAAAALPETLSLGLRKVRNLRYGENPHQPAAWYVHEGDAAANQEPRILQGKELSFTNLLDLDSASRIVAEFSEPAAVVVKHTNPCGVATGTSAADAYVRAREADPMAAFGGIVALNRPIDEDAARAIVSTFIEAVIAPSVEASARPVLAGKANMRVLEGEPYRQGAAPPAGPGDVRSIFAGLLVQERDRIVEAWQQWPGDGDAEGSGSLRVVTKRQPTAAEWQALRFAWRVCAHVKSNAVIFTSADRTLAVGAGQMSRVDAVRVAVMKAHDAGGRILAGSVAASDAFFPFRDGLDAIAVAGATAVVQPGGSVRDAEVIAAADEHGMAMVFAGRRHFRH
jgi:phosphoribosylaminoimidazolecarboxamide formyltransferase / IMP cyclohydrolase